jgi:hypothetical protein
MKASSRHRRLAQRHRTLCADVLAENAPMRAILAHAGIKWQPAHVGVVHGYAAVPDPGKFGITPGTAAALAAVVDELKIRL